MNPLEMRKQLLIAESELNRVQLTEEIAQLTGNVHNYTNRAKSFVPLASSAAVLVAGLAGYQRGKAVAGGEKPSIIQTLIKGAGLISTVALLFRASGSKREDHGKP